MVTASRFDRFYQVGGSLPCHASTYVYRQADEVLFQGLQRGEFCYVFNARQMGKSSLRVQTTHRLQAIGVRCGVVDITTIGTRDVMPEQWYASIAGLLTKAFRLEVHLIHWWRDHSHLSVVNRLSEFLDTVLLSQVLDPIVIFIDEIDSVLGLPFATDDFFALIRACYNRRAEQSRYQRLTFALFGVATPTDLIADTRRTPFNIGQAIELRGFQPTEVFPLRAGLADVLPDPDLALQQILDWTGGQPFLTQKICQLVLEEWKTGAAQQHSIPAFIDRLIHTQLLNRWEAQDEPEHLKTIRDRLLYSEQKAGRLLGLYQQILLKTSSENHNRNTEKNIGKNLNQSDSENINVDLGIFADDSPEQMELILTGLVEKRSGRLHIKNPIYEQVFNFDWVSQQLAHLRPYSQSINAWIVSGYEDGSRLLRGQALRDALNWAQNKSLSDLDYRFLAASQECDLQEQQRLAEAERLKEVEARLQLEQLRSLEQRRNLRRQRLLLGIVSVVMMMAIALGLFAYRQYQQTAISELKAVILSSEALFASNKGFDALLQAIRAKERLATLKQADAELKTKANAALWRTVLSIQEYNRLDGHTAAVLTVDFSPDGKQIATAGVDGTIKLWQPDGTLIKTWQGHASVVRSIKFSPDGTLLATGGDDKIINLWRRDGTLFKRLPLHSSGIWSLDFSPTGATLISAGPDHAVEVWSREGKWLMSLPGEQSGVRVVAYSPDGQMIAAGNTNATIELWHSNGTQRQTLTGHEATVQALAFSPDSRMLVSASTDGVIKVWNSDGTLLKTIQGHEMGIWGLDFSANGEMFASAGRDKTVKLWNSNGTLLSTLQGHSAAVWAVAFSPDSRAIASAGAENTTLLWQTASDFQKTIHGVTDLTLKLLFSKDGTLIATVGNDKAIKLWQLDGTLLRSINAHEASTGRIDLSRDGTTLASVSEDKTLKLWKLDGTLLRVFKDATTALVSVSWHPHERKLAASGADGTIWLWNTDGTLLKTLKGHQAAAWDVKFSPDGQLLASASNDTTVRLWNSDGTLLKILQGHRAAVWQVAFSPDSQLLASSSGDTTVKLWTRDGTLYKTLTGHRAAVWGIAFSADNTLIATASIDETIKLWTRDGQLLTTLEGHHSGVRALAFHPYQPILASAGDDETIMLWNVDQILRLDPLTYACNWVRPYLHTNPHGKQEKLCQQ